jgi:mediator of RNA polymerase II transcription subunit 12, fungi type
MPVDIKVTPFNPFQFYPDIQLSMLPKSLPDACFKQFKALFKTVQLLIPVTNLAMSDSDLDGHRTTASVAYCPWEWTENLGEQNTGSKGIEQWMSDKQSIKNSSSVPLEKFGTVIEGEGIPPSLSAESSPPGRVRSFEDGLSFESLFVRNWRESSTDNERLRAQNVDESSKDGMDFGIINDNWKPIAPPSPSSLSQLSFKIIQPIAQSPAQYAGLKRQTALMDRESLESDFTSTSAAKGSSKRNIDMATGTSEQIIETKSKKQKLMKATSKRRGKKQ